MACIYRLFRQRALSQNSTTAFENVFFKKKTNIRLKSVNSPAENRKKFVPGKRTKVGVSNLRVYKHVATLAGSSGSLSVTAQAISEQSSGSKNQALRDSGV